MRLSTRIFGLGLLAMAFLCAAGSAEAASFADYVYQNAKTGNIAGIKNYLRRGYSIDAVSPNGYTALCFAVDNNDYRAYSRIRGRNLPTGLRLTLMLPAAETTLKGLLTSKMRETATFMACTAENSCLTPCLTADRTKREIRTAKPRER